MTKMDRRALLLLLAAAYATLAYASPDDDDDGPGGGGGPRGNSGAQGGPAAVQQVQQQQQAAMAARRKFMTRMIIAHGVMMSLAFAFMMPLGSALMRLLKFRGTAYIHGAWQTLAYMVALAGFGIGLWFARQINFFDSYHAIIGIIVIGMLFLQPLGGFVAHIMFKRKGGRNLFGGIHRWVGRIFVTLGGINGGLGIYLAGSRRHWVIGYSVTAAIFFALWYGVSLLDWVRNRRHSAKNVTYAEEKAHVGRGSESF